MRILVLNRSREIIGGVETYLRDVLPLLAADGNEVWFGYEDEARAGFESVTEAGPTAVHIKGSAALSGLIETTRPDVIFSHGLNLSESERIVSSYPNVIQFMHSYQGACISGRKCHAFPTLQPCTRSLGPGCLAYFFPRRCGGLDPFVAGRLYHEQRLRQKSLRRAAGVLVASEHMRREAVRNGISSDSIGVAPYFPTRQIRDASPPLPRPQTDRLLFVGRATKIKGLMVALKALPIIQQSLGRVLTLVVAGDGQEIGAVARLANEVGIQLSLHGWVGPRDRELLMRSVDLLLVPSLWPEPFGIVGIEAGAIGLPAVAFAQGGIPEWLDSGFSGELSFGEPTANGLAVAAIRALRSPKHLQELRIGAWHSSARYSVARHLAVVLPLLKRAQKSGSYKSY